MKLKNRPMNPSDHERALWWRTRRPTKQQLLRWQQQVTIDISKEWGSGEESLDEDELCRVPAMILPAEAFRTPEAHTPVETYEREVPRTWLWSGDDAWTVLFKSKLAGHGQPEVADELRESLCNRQLPSSLETTILNRVLSELTLREWVDIAICENWTVARAAEIARNAGCWKFEICNWLNSYAAPDTLSMPGPVPSPESALETYDRCFQQILRHT